ncbi:MAG: tRNA pseudouridine(38-40) synthase TruA [Ruminococcaceae bacterium]|nr:tRNA pseudouridine(38-40) synthase TruA [Oscillospiraceae bacterium]
MNILVTIMFDGTAYHGWQFQKNSPTVQSEVSKAVDIIFNTHYDIHGCSRTDSGVHANRFCFNFLCDKPTFDVERLPRALNTLLPFDISAVKAEVVDDEFHARYSCKAKEYEYLIWNEFYRNPFYRTKACFYPKPLDVDSLNEICSHFVGEHDFASFMSDGSKIIDTVRKIEYFTAKRDGGIIKFSICANGFLYNMVRILVGTVCDIYHGRIKEKPEEIIRLKSRKSAGFTAPAHGLYLNKIIY